MQTTILIMLLTAISSFAAGWFLKHRNIINSMEAVLEDIKKATRTQNNQLLDTYSLFRISEEKGGIQSNILRLTEHKLKMRSMINELDEEYFQKLEIIETANKKIKSESQQRLEKLKSKSSALSSK